MSALDAAIADVVRTVLREELASGSGGDEWIPIADVDEMVGRRERRRAQLDGDLTTVRRGRRTFTRRSWLDAYLEAGDRPKPTILDEDDAHAGELIRLSRRRAAR